MSNYQNVTPKQFGQAAMPTAGYSTLYTVLTNTRIYVKQMDICNTTAGALGAYVHFVPSGGTAGTGNAIYYNKSTPANDTIQWKGVQIMNAGDTIQIKGSGAGLTITVSGGEAV